MNIGSPIINAAGQRTIKNNDNKIFTMIEIDFLSLNEGNVMMKISIPTIKYKKTIPIKYIFM